MAVKVLTLQPLSYINVNVDPLYRDPQLQVSESYLHKSKWSKMFFSASTFCVLIINKTTANGFGRD